MAAEDQNAQRRCIPPNPITRDPSDRNMSFVEKLFAYACKHSVDGQAGKESKLLEYHELRALP